MRKLIIASAIGLASASYAVSQSSGPVSSRLLHEDELKQHFIEFDQGGHKFWFGCYAFISEPMPFIKFRPTGYHYSPALNSGMGGKLSSQAGPISSSLKDDENLKYWKRDWFYEDFGIRSKPSRSYKEHEARVYEFISEVFANDQVHFRLGRKPRTITIRYTISDAHRRELKRLCKFS